MGAMGFMSEGSLYIFGAILRCHDLMTVQKACTLSLLASCWDGKTGLKGLEDGIDLTKGKACFKKKSDWLDGMCMQSDFWILLSGFN